MVAITRHPTVYYLKLPTLLWVISAQTPAYIAVGTVGTQHHPPNAISRLLSLYDEAASLLLSSLSTLQLYDEAAFLLLSSLSSSTMKPPPSC